MVNPDEVLKFNFCPRHGSCYALTTTGSGVEKWEPKIYVYKIKTCSICYVVLWRELKLFV